MFALARSRTTLGLKANLDYNGFFAYKIEGWPIVILSHRLCGKFIGTLFYCVIHYFFLFKDGEEGVICEIAICQQINFRPRRGIPLIIS